MIVPPQPFSHVLASPHRSLSVAPTVDAVLLTFSDLEHLGALPYAHKHMGLNAPVYATEPVKQMGHFFMYEAYAVRLSAAASWGRRGT